MNNRTILFFFSVVCVAVSHWMRNMEYHRRLCWYS